MIVDIGVPEVICQYLRGPVASANCTIEYGTDPTYLNLPNIASSTGTNVINVTIPLVSLQRATLYYYVVSTMGVRMQGIFRSSTYVSLMCLYSVWSNRRVVSLICSNVLTGCAHEDLGVADATPDERCTYVLQNSAQFTGGVVCYTGVTAGSVVVYVCNSTHHLEGSRFRGCLTNGSWSGISPQCVGG